MCSGCDTTTFSPHSALTVKFKFHYERFRIQHKLSSWKLSLLLSTRQSLLATLASLPYMHGAWVVCKNCGWSIVATQCYSFTIKWWRFLLKHHYLLCIAGINKHISVTICSPFFSLSQSVRSCSNFTLCLMLLLIIIPSVVLIQSPCRVRLWNANGIGGIIHKVI